MPALKWSFLYRAPGWGVADYKLKLNDGQLCTSEQPRNKLRRHDDVSRYSSVR